MPLSENEQRIFSDIKKNLQKTDPKFAREVEGSAVYRKSLLSLRLPIAGMLLGLALMVSTLRLHYLFAFAGFLVMFVSALGLEKKIRLMGKTGLQDITDMVNSFRPGSKKNDTEDQAE